MTVCFLLNTEPSASPDSISSASLSATSISVQWGEVACIHRNGEIPGYVARVLRTEEEVETVMVAQSEREVAVTGLFPSTEYAVQVAAVNSAGIGPFNTTIPIITTGKGL